MIGGFKTMWPSSLRVSIVVVWATLWVVVTPGIGNGEQWKGSGDWQSRSGGAMRGTWSVVLDRSEAGVEGTIALSGSPLFADSRVMGTIEGEEVVLGVLAQGDQELRFRGVLTDGRIEGTWDCPAIGDGGIWSGTFRPRGEP